MKVIIVLGVAFLLLALEDWLEGTVPLSGLLAIMSMAMAFAKKSVQAVTNRLAAKFGKLWLAAEVLLFVLVGAAVDIRYTLDAGAGAVLMIFLALIFRSFGVWLCMLKTTLNAKERLYCVIAYLPKATVQAAIGGVPLSLGLPCGSFSAVCGGAVHSYHRTPRGYWNGFELSQAFAQRGYGIGLCFPMYRAIFVFSAKKS